MDVQKTMEFILEQQAHMAATQVEHSARMAEIEKVALRTENRLDGLTTIVTFGMKVVLKQGRGAKPDRRKTSTR